MENLIEIIEKNGILEADSRDVARVLGVEHRSIVRLMSTYQKELEYSDFKSTYSGEAGRPEKWGMLNERQCLLLITLVKNTPEALAAKSALVDAFLRMRDFIEKKLSAIADQQAMEIIYLDSKKNRGTIGAKRTHFGVYEFFAMHEIKLTAANWHWAISKARRYSEDMNLPWQVVYAKDAGEIDGFHIDVLNKILKEIN